MNLWTVATFDDMRRAGCFWLGPVSLCCCVYYNHHHHHHYPIQPTSSLLVDGVEPKVYGMRVQGPQVDENNGGSLGKRWYGYKTHGLTILTYVERQTQDIAGSAIACGRVRVRTQGTT